MFFDFFLSMNEFIIKTSSTIRRLLNSLIKYIKLMSNNLSYVNSKHEHSPLLTTSKRIPDYGTKPLRTYICYFLKENFK